MKDNTLSKRGQLSLGVLQGAALTFVVLVLVIAVGALIVTNFQNNVVTQGGGNLTPTFWNSSMREGMNLTWNATHSGLQGFVTMGDQTPLIALIIVMAFIIGVVVVAFGMRGMGGAA